MTLDDLIKAGEAPEVLGTGYGFTEGPAADARGNIYFSDGRNDSIHYYEIGRPIVPFVIDSTDANGMIFSETGELLVCEGAAHRIVAFNVATREKRILCDSFEGLPFNEPNDLAADRHGGIYFSDPNYSHHGQETIRKEDAYYRAADGTIRRVSDTCNKPNGVLLSPDGNTLYLADSRGPRIYMYDVIGPGELKGERIFVDDMPGNPDGLTLDVHGNLYVGMNRAGLAVYDAAGRPIGRREEIHVSNLCFGGPDFRTLFLACSNIFVGLPMQVEGIRPICEIS